MTGQTAATLAGCTDHAKGEVRARASTSGDAVTDLVPSRPLRSSVATSRSDARCSRARARRTVAYRRVGDTPTYPTQEEQS